MRKGYAINADYIQKVLQHKNDNNNNKVWTCDEIVDLIVNSDTFVINSLIMLHSYQTEQEKNNESTNEKNGVGFNQYDAKSLTDIYNKMVKYNKITIGQVDYVRKRIIKYRKQITRIANHEI